MRPLEMSILAAGAALSLVAGGGAAKLALTPLDAALAGHQQALAEETEAQQPTASIVDQPAPETIAYRPDIQPTADDLWNAQPVAMPVRDDGPSQAGPVNDGAASDADSAHMIDVANQADAEPGDAESGPVAPLDPPADSLPAPGIEPVSGAPPAEPADPPRQDPEK